MFLLIIQILRIRNIERNYRISSASNSKVLPKTKQTSIVLRNTLVKDDLNK